MLELLITKAVRMLWLATIPRGTPLVSLPRMSARESLIDGKHVVTNKDPFGFSSLSKNSKFMTRDLEFAFFVLSVAP